MALRAVAGELEIDAALHGSLAGAAHRSSAVTEAFRNVQSDALGWACGPRASRLTSKPGTVSLALVKLLGHTLTSGTGKTFGRHGSERRDDWMSEVIAVLVWSKNAVTPSLACGCSLVVVGSFATAKTGGRCGFSPEIASRAQSLSSGGPASRSAMRFRIQIDRARLYK